MTTASSPPALSSDQAGPAKGGEGEHVGLCRSWVRRTLFWGAFVLADRAGERKRRRRSALPGALHMFWNWDDVEVVPTVVVKKSQKLYRFFTDLFTGWGRGGLIWLDWVGLGWTESDPPSPEASARQAGEDDVKTLKR